MNFENITHDATLVDMLIARTAREGSREAFTFLQDGESEEALLTYAELDNKARTIAAALLARGAQAERVLLLYPPGPEYLVALFGCLYAGAVAVPAYPPRHNRNLVRLGSVITDSRATFALATPQTVAMVERQFSDVPCLQGLQWLTTGELEQEAAAWSKPDITGESLALLQYTSGSTGTPKGVMLTHGNLLHNLGLISEGFGVEPSDRGVIWLPPYHDMGLIGGILQPIFAGIPCTLMSPFAFIQRPLRWLQSITRYRGTVSGGPNFAYDLCARKISAEEKASLDLSSWQVAFCGAEPIRMETLDRFAEAFEPCGFRREAFYPCYGLAEATLFVSGGVRGAGPVGLPVSREWLRDCGSPAEMARGESLQTLVGCGGISDRQQVIIADLETGTPCPEGQIGEIRVSGPSAARGYWNRPELTEATFLTCLPGGAGPFLRTGDLGFIRNGELFITGRIKDLIIIRGRNYYPQDIEWTAEQSHPELRRGCGAAFGVDVSGEERLVIVHEIERHPKDSPEAICRAVRQAVAAEHDVQVYGIVLVETSTIPKTSSGKIQRHLCREKFLSGDLAGVTMSIAGTHTPGEDQPLTGKPAEPLVLFTAGVFAAVLQLPECGPEQSLLEIGGDSLRAAEIAAVLEAALEVHVPLEMVLTVLTPMGVARELTQRWVAEGKEPEALRERLEFLAQQDLHAAFDQANESFD